MGLFGNKKEEISKNMIGLFFEDINFAADGGLYAEMIENRSFEARDAYGNPGNFYAVEDLCYAWSPVSTSYKMPDMKVVTGTPLYMTNPHYLRFTATEKGQGFANKAYDGIYAKSGEVLNLKFYARAVKYNGGFRVSITKDGKEYSSADLDCKAVIPFMPFSDTTVDFKSGNDDWDAKIQNIKDMDKTGLAKASSWIKYETKLKVS
ncbi:MAG: hypothetical protein K6F00_06405 [Lachnospiraceae bacterium]|nr:hypothetical protein [Lachnospiraceae bacterium]